MVLVYYTMVRRWSVHALRSLPRQTALAALVWCAVSGLAPAQSSAPSAELQAPNASARHSSIGREVAVPMHLQDGQEFTIPLDTTEK